MKYWIFFELSFKQMFRAPMYLVATLVFPAMFYSFFGVAPSTSDAAARIVFTNFATFALFGVFFFQLASTLSLEIHSEWAQFLRTQPFSVLDRVAVELITSVVMGFLAVSLLWLAAFFLVDFGAWSQFPWGAVIMGWALGVVPCLLLAWSLALFIGPKAMVPVANLIYLPLSFAGGLWLPPEQLPEMVRKISPYLYTRQWGELLRAKVLPNQAAMELDFYQRMFWVYFVGLFIVTVLLTLVRRWQMQWR